MSIEKDLSRIADALERLVELEANPMREVRPDKIDAPGINSPKKSVIPTSDAPKAPVASTPPGIGGIAALSPAVQVGVTVTPGFNIPQTPEELRLIAQKIAQKAGGKTLLFTQYVNSILLPYGVKTVMAVPTDKLTEVAFKMSDWAKNELSSS